MRCRIEAQREKMQRTLNASDRAAGEAARRAGMKPEVLERTEGKEAVMMKPSSQRMPTQLPAFDYFGGTRPVDSTRFPY